MKVEFTFGCVTPQADGKHGISAASHTSRVRHSTQQYTIVKVWGFGPQYTRMN